MCARAHVCVCFQSETPTISECVESATAAVCQWLCWQCSAGFLVSLADPKILLPKLIGTFKGLSEKSNLKKKIKGKNFSKSI